MITLSASLFRKSPWLIMVFCALNACTRIETLQNVVPTGTPFQTALTQKYTEFAVSEAKQCDWIDSQRFIDKGMHAAYGQTTPPEELKEWNIPENILPQLTAARAELIEVLSKPELLDAQPETAAEAQFSFDCWVEQQEENWQTEDIEECRDDFYSALSELKAQKIAEALPMTPIPLTPEEIYNYRVFFDFNSAKVTPKTQKVIDNIIADIKNLKDYEFVLNGYADRAGDEDYNLELSKQRAIAVRKKLVAAGLPEKSITIFAYGEEDNAVETEDGVAEKANRRVEIVISD